MSKFSSSITSNQSGTRTYNALQCSRIVHLNSWIHIEFCTTCGLLYCWNIYKYMLARWSCWLAVMTVMTVALVCVESAFRFRRCCPAPFSDCIEMPDITAHIVMHLSTRAVMFVFVFVLVYVHAFFLANWFRSQPYKRVRMANIPFRHYRAGHERPECDCGRGLGRPLKCMHNMHARTWHVGHSTQHSNGEKSIRLLCEFQNTKLEFRLSMKPHKLIIAWIINKYV